MKKLKIILTALLATGSLMLAQLQINAHTPALVDTYNPTTVVAAERDIFRTALYKHRPVLRFDKDERFFALRADAITDNVGNKLARDEDPNYVIAERRPPPPGRGFGIGYLKSGLYPNGQEVFDNDKIFERHDEDGNYRQDAERLQCSGPYEDDPHCNHHYADVIYGRIFYIRDEDNRVTGAWLQYWFFYYYNNFPIDGGGDHEGDWEMIQIRVDANATPQLAVYAHHNSGGWSVWRDVERARSDNDRPVVYVALGSHASYFHRGSAGQDRTNGGQNQRRTRRLVRIGNKSPKWNTWPGFWGSTKGSIPFITADSPRGPSRQGDKWTDPNAFFQRVILNECKKP